MTRQYRPNGTKYNNVASTKYCKMNKKDKLSSNLTVLNNLTWPRIGAFLFKINHIFLLKNNRHSTLNLIHNNVQYDDTDMIFLQIL